MFVYLEYNNKTKNTNIMKTFKTVNNGEKAQILTFGLVMMTLAVTVISWAINGFITTL